MNSKYAACKRITGKDYENAGSNPIVNVDAMIDGLSDIFKIQSRLRTKEDFEDVCRFYGDNIEKFKKLWGRQSVCWTGWERFWIWKHDMDYCDMYVLTAPTRGTSYEVVIKGDMDKAVQEARVFFTLLLDELRELEQ